jgi:hypothetical protein
MDTETRLYAHTKLTSALPLTDERMWRWLLSRVRPEAGGSHEGFIWTQDLKKLVCSVNLGAQPSPKAHPELQSGNPDRVPYPPGIDFEEMTWRALWHAPTQPEVYSRLLSLLDDCRPLDHMWREQQRGASYKRLAAIGHAAGMDKAERVDWYRVAEGIPLSDRHAGHILSKLKRQAT